MKSSTKKTERRRWPWNGSKTSKRRRSALRRGCSKRERKASEQEKVNNAARLILFVRDDTPWLCELKGFPHVGGLLVDFRGWFVFSTSALIYSVWHLLDVYMIDADDKNTSRFFLWKKVNLGTMSVNPDRSYLQKNSENFELFRRYFSNCRMDDGEKWLQPLRPRKTF